MKASVLILFAFNLRSSAATSSAMAGGPERYVCRLAMSGTLPRGTSH